MDEQQEAELARLIAAYTDAFEARPDTPYLHAFWVMLRRRPIQESLVRVLTPVATPLAQRIARGRGLRDWEDFGTQAPWFLIEPRPKAELPRICALDPELGSFEPWARKTFENAVKDELRRGRGPIIRPAARPSEVPPDPDRSTQDPHCRRASFEPLHENLPARDAGQTTWRARTGSFLGSPFPERDLWRMEQWGPQVRFELTLISGWWVKFLNTTGLWERVQREYETAQNVSLPVEFPPTEFLTAETERERVAALAPYLRCTETALLGRWYRDRALLKELHAPEDYDVSGP